MKHTFEIPFDLVPSFNVILRKHRWNRNSHRDVVFSYMNGLLLKQGKKFIKIDKCHVRLIGYMVRFRDWDGFSTGAKFLLDALVIYGILKDDSPKYVLSFTSEQIKVSKLKEQKFIFEVEEV